jgi:hypothetical protein
MTLELQHQGPKLTRAQLEAYAEKHRLSLPEPLADFLLEHNGGRLDDRYAAPVGDGTDTAGLTFFGAFEREPELGQTDISQRASVSSNRPDKWLTPFAYDAFGNLFAIATREKDLGSVWFWDHETNRSRMVSPAFESFLESLRYEELEAEKPNLAHFLKTESLEQLARRLPAALAENASYNRYCVACSTRLDVLRWMIENGFGAGMLLKSVEQGNLAFVEELLARGTDPDETNEDRTTPLIKAAEYGHREIVERLLDAGANPKHKDDLDETPVSTAKYYEQPEIVKLLKARIGSAPAKKPAKPTNSKPTKSKPTNSKPAKSKPAKKKRARR